MGVGGLRGLGMQTIQFLEKHIPLFINNIRHRKPLPVYGKGENVRDWLYVVDQIGRASCRERV